MATTTYTVTVFDYLSGDAEAQCVDTFDTEAEARTIAIMHLEEAAAYAESAALRTAFEKSALAFEVGGAMTRRVDGFQVSIRKSN